MALYRNSDELLGPGGTETVECNIFDCMSDVGDVCLDRIREDSQFKTRVRQNSTFSEPEWVGRSFKDPESVVKAVCSPWDEGRKEVETMLDELAREDIPVPTSIRRKPRFSPDFGDEVCHDRLRSGQDYWRYVPRLATAGSRNITIVCGVSTSSYRNWKEVLWRGAVEIVLSRLLQDAGYSVELWAVNRTSNHYFGQTGNMTAVKVKALDQDVDVDSLTTCVSGWCFRSLWFMAMCLSDHGRMAQTGLGRPKALSPEDCAVFTPDSKVLIVDRFFDRSCALDAGRRLLEEFCESSREREAA